MKKSKLLSAILLVATVFSVLLVPAAATFYNESDAPELVVEVYVNKYDEEYILNTVLDDGTRIGDYNYTIRYITPASRASNMLEDYFDFCGWFSNPDGLGWTLSLDPNTAVRDSRPLQATAWTVLRNSWYGAGGNPYWTSETSMKDQYDCHCQFALTKDRWNLDNWRPVVSWTEMITSGCNPGPS